MQGINGLTVGELVSMLEQFEPDQPVLLASQPSWPFAYRLADELVEVDGTVWLAEAGQLSYLPGNVAQELGWSE